MTRELSGHQGFRLWRRLANGVEVLRAQKGEWRGFRAFSGEREVGHWSRHGSRQDSPPTGHVLGNYAQVQGHDAPCRDLSAWLDAIGEL